MFFNLVFFKVFLRVDIFFILRVMEDNGILKKLFFCRYLLYKRIIFLLFCIMFCIMYIFFLICIYEFFLFRRIVKFFVLIF